MDKKIKVIQTLMNLCFRVGIYLMVYLLVLSVAGSISALKELHPMYLNAAAMGLAAVALAFTIKKEAYDFSGRENLWKNFIAVILLAYGTSALFNIILGQIPWQEWFQSQVTPDADVYYGIPLWARMVCYELVAPLAEELLFRQVIFGKLKKIAPVWLAVIISALAFGLYHGNLVQGLYAFLMGVFLALVYEWTGNFVFPVLFHMIANHLSDICYEFPNVGETVYSMPGLVVSILLVMIGLFIINKKQNKCSKNTLQSS